MIVEDKKIDRICSFYVSEYHLEMILLPYIKEKIENKENITIQTQKDLRETVETVISKMNLKEENRREILNLGWNKNESKEITEKSNIIIIGTEDYIEQTNNKIEDLKINNINIVDCYNFEDVKENMNNIMNNHSKSLNMMGYNKF